MMTLFNIAVLIRTTGLYLVAFEAAVLCQAPVVVGKDLRITYRINRTGQIVGSVVLRKQRDVYSVGLKKTISTLHSSRNGEKRKTG
jgi:hypothetical protein